MGRTGTDKFIHFSCVSASIDYGKTINREIRVAPLWPIFEGLPFVSDLICLPLSAGKYISESA